MFEDTSGMDSIHCSFCGKSQNEVKKIVAGPGVYICNECVDLCKQIIDQELDEYMTDNYFRLQTP